MVAGKEVVEEAAEGENNVEDADEGGKTEGL